MTVATSIAHQMSDKKDLSLTERREGSYLRDAVSFVIILAALYEILYNQTGDKLYRTARKAFTIAAAIGIIIEIAGLV